MVLRDEQGRAWEVSCHEKIPLLGPRVEGSCPFLPPFWLARTGTIALLHPGQLPGQLLLLRSRPQILNRATQELALESLRHLIVWDGEEEVEALSRPRFAGFSQKRPILPASAEVLSFADSASVD